LIQLARANDSGFVTDNGSQHNSVLPQVSREENLSYLEAERLKSRSCKISGLLVS
jgi:hypothetical protein